MIDAEKLLDRLLGELPKPDGSPESLAAYLDAVERIIKILKEYRKDVDSTIPAIPTPPIPPIPRHPWETMRPIGDPKPGSFPKMMCGRDLRADEDDGA